MQKIPGAGHFYGQFWQAFPKGFRRPKATTFKKIPSGDGASQCGHIIIQLFAYLTFLAKLAGATRLIRAL